jgi:hypothetical protein
MFQKSNENDGPLPNNQNHAARLARYSMAKTRLVHYERTDPVTASFVALLTLEHVDVLEAFVAVSGHLGARAVPQDRDPGAIGSFMQNVYLHAVAQISKRQRSEIGRQKRPNAARAQA